MKADDLSLKEMNAQVSYWARRLEVYNLNSNWDKTKHAKKQIRYWKRAIGRKIEKLDKA